MGISSLDEQSVSGGKEVGSIPIFSSVSIARLAARMSDQSGLSGEMFFDILIEL